MIRDKATKGIKTPFSGTDYVHEIAGIEMQVISSGYNCLNF